MELRKLIEEEDSIVGQRDFSGAGIGVSTDQACCTNRMMWRPKRPERDKLLLGSKEAADTVYGCRFKSFGKSHWWHDCRDAFCQHCLPGAGWTDQHDIVATGAGNLDSPPGGKLSFNVGEIEVAMLHGLEKVFPVDGDRISHRAVFTEELEYLVQGTGRINRDSFDYGCFPSVVFWNEELCETVLSSTDGNRQGTLDWPHLAVERKLTEDEPVLQFLGFESSQQAE